MDLEGLRLETARLVLRPVRGEDFEAWAAFSADPATMRHLGWTDIIQTIAPDNAPSQAVARRLGATVRGPGQLPAPYENHPSEIWGQTREQWRSNRLRLRS